MERMGENRALLFGLLLLGVGLVVGYLGAGVLAAPAPTEARDQAQVLDPTRTEGAAQGANRELTIAIGELRQTMDLLRRHLERAPVAAPAGPASTRTPVGGPAFDAEGLAASMGALAAAIRTLPTGGARGSSDAGLVAPGFVDRRTAFATDDLKRTIRADTDGDATEAAVRGYRNDHLFWTKQEILDRYGKPDAVYPSDGFVTWCYEVHGSEDYEDIDFAFDEGVVVSVQYDYSWEE